MENITIIGIGNIGLGLALLIEKANYNVIGVDINTNYIEKLNSKTFFSYEPLYNDYLKNSSLKTYKLLNKDDKYDELESFIEQYICCKSKIFVYCGGETAWETYRKPWRFHKRSSWSSFVTDNRNYLLKKQPTTNILLPEIFGNDL
jgi:hypothetical protein|tara:strand:+ start:356 stop:793 length:438 start_codon:yes stop_codon:yes gene_type:complete